MKRLVSRHFAGLATVAFGIVAFTTAGVTRAQAQPADFGTPPSGEVPILFNDTHVYAKPDTLRQGRVLAALVRGAAAAMPRLVLAAMPPRSAASSQRMRGSAA